MDDCSPAPFHRKALPNFRLSHSSSEKPHYGQTNPSLCVFELRLPALKLPIMNWKTIRLELGSTSEHPFGSAGRSYLVRLPLDEAGVVDEAALSGHPGQATVRRFWPSEPDRIGRIERAGSGWALRCNGGCNDEIISWLDPQPIQLGGEIIVTEADGTRLPFRVASIRRLA